MFERFEHRRRGRFRCFLGITYTIGVGSIGLESTFETAK